MGINSFTCNYQEYEEKNSEIIKKRESFNYSNNEINQSFSNYDNDFTKINEQIETNDNLKTETNLKQINTTNYPKDDYSNFMFENINKLRENPQNFIELLENSKKNIKLLKNGKYIFKSRLNVALYKGEEAFNEAINDLKNTNKMNKLIYNPKITIPPPDKEEDIKSMIYLKNEISKLKIKGYWRDNISDPEIGFILMIVDDIEKLPGLKRKNLLDPNMKYIGISSKKIGKTFCGYFTLSNIDNL